MAESEHGGGLYRDIFEATQDPIMVHDADTGEILEANPAAGKLLGIERDAVVGMEVGEFSPPGFSSSAANDLIREAAENGESAVEWAVRGPENEQRWVDVALERACIDGTTRVVAFIRDVTEHKASERRYRAERDMLDRLLDISPVGIVIHGPDGAIERTNERAEEIFDVERGDLLGVRGATGQISIESVDGQPLEMSDLPVQQVIQTGEPIRDQELVVDNGDGNRLILSISATPFRQDGEIDKVVATITDVTDRYERERSHKEQTEQLQAMVDNLPVIVFTLDPDGLFTHSAGKGLEALGIESGDFEGMSVFDVYGEYDDIVEAAGRALDGEEVRDTHSLDGMVFETWYQPVFDGAGDLAEVVGVARDITELTRRERQLEELSGATLELQYSRSQEAVAETVTDIVAETIERPIAVMWAVHDEAEALDPIGATEAVYDIAGVQSPTELSSVGDGTVEMRIFEAGETTVIEDYQQVDRPAVPASPLGTVLCLPLGEHGILCVGSEAVEPFDDTERFLLEILAAAAGAALDRVDREAEMEAQRAELQRSNEALQQFAYIASHDLQEPLRMVSSYVDLLADEYGDELDDEAQEYMEFAVDGATRMKAMIDGLLSYSRVATRGASFEPVDVTEVLETTLRELELLLTDAGTAVEYGTLPRVAADRAQLGQVFQNLLKNAVTHGEAATVEVSATVRDEDVRFAVADDGVGIPPDQQNRLFDIFKQGHDAEGGSGIGLAVCERIVHRHDGEIWIESEPGAGATIYFTLPGVESDEDR